MLVQVWDHSPSWREEAQVRRAPQATRGWLLNVLIGRSSGCRAKAGTIDVPLTWQPLRLDNGCSGGSIWGQTFAM